MNSEITYLFDYIRAEILIVMKKKDFFNMVIEEITDMALSARRDNCKDVERKFYREVSELSRQKEEVLAKLTVEDRQVIEKYIIKINHIANQECQYLYMKGARDCVKLLKRLRIL